MNVLNFIIILILISYIVSCNAPVTYEKEYVTQLDDGAGGNEGQSEKSSAVDSPEIEASSVKTGHGVEESTILPKAPSFTSNPLVGSGSLSLSWSHDMKNVSYFLVLRSESEIVTNPTDGVKYSVGDSIDSAVVTYLGAELDFVDSMVDNYKDYKFKIFGVNSQRSYSAGLALTGFAAMAGTLDSTFAVNGRFVFDSIIGGSNERVRDVEITSDGSIYVAAHAEKSDGNMDAVVIKLTKTGSLDASFGNNGVWSHFNSTGLSGVHYAHKIEVDSLGNVVVVGHQSSPNVRLMIWRLDQYGNLDASFNSNGFVKQEPSGAFTSSRGYSVTTDLQGKIVVCGTIYSDRSNIGVWRYRPDGSLDTSFNSTGYSAFPLTNTGDVGSDCAYSQLDNSIVVVGYTGNQRPIVLKINNNGLLATDFADISGQLPNRFTFRAVKVDNAGSIYVTGRYRNDSFDYVATTLKLDQNGDIDADFGVDSLYYDQGTNSSAYSVLLRPDDGLFMVGNTVSTSRDISFWNISSSGLSQDFLNGQHSVSDSNAAGGVDVVEDAFTANLNNRSNGLLIGGYGVNASGNDDIVIWKYK